VPVFNSARYLATTLASLNAQGADVRWWLQDGASTDDTLTIAQKCVRPGDTMVSEPDNGQPEALNRAFAQMGGEIVGFLNGDDLLAPGAARLFCGESERRSRLWLRAVDRCGGPSRGHAHRSHRVARRGARPLRRVVE
jgi:glycosyltransferase involved in cell wall biosynthesis